MKKLIAPILFIMGLLSFGACEKIDWDFKNHHGDKDENPIYAQVATDWYKLQLRILLERNSALNGSYFSYIGIALYESVRHIEDKSVSLSSSLYQMPAMPAKENHKKYFWPASANAAMAKIVRSYFTGLTPANIASIDSLENAYNSILKPLVQPDVFDRSQAYGISVATAVYNWSLTDNFNPSNVGYVPPVFPGAWQPTPPAFANGVSPFLASARPLLSSLSTLTAPPHLPYSEDINSDFYKMVKEVYDVSLNLTTEQKNIALFWVDQGNGVGYTPPGHDMSIVTQALEKEKANLFVTAEAYAKAGIAEREGTIVCFKAKYVNNLIRPVSYIRNHIDPVWLPFIGTPPHPEYPAAHALVTGSVMQAVSKVLGNNLSFVDHTYDFRGWQPRSFGSLFKAGEEAGISRLYGGIHYKNSIDVGLSIAKEVGNKVGNIKVTGHNN